MQGERGLEVVRQTAGPSTVFVLVGDLDVHSAPLVQQAVASAAGEGASDVVLDLAGVTFIDSSGVGVLVVCHKRTEAAGARLVLRSPSPRIARLLEVTTLDRVLTVEGPPTR